MFDPKIFTQWVTDDDGNIAAAYPKVLLLAAFLLVLSFWVDLCHQANDEEEEDDDSSIQHALLVNSQNKHHSSNTDGHRICCSFPSIHVGSHQKFAIAVVGFVLILMMSFSIMIWIGAGKNSIDSSVVAQDGGAPSLEPSGGELRDVHTLTACGCSALIRTVYIYTHTESRSRADVCNYVKVRTPAQINSGGTDRQLFLLVPNKMSILSFFLPADSMVMSFEAGIELLQVFAVFPAPDLLLRSPWDST
ncbi:hypothetical protein ACLB2K_058730 [Fragaria x ananassa]